MGPGNRLVLGGLTLPPLGSLEPHQRAVLEQLCLLLPLGRVNWALTGSAAHALQGVPVEVHDLDVQTDEGGAYAVGATLADFVLEPVALVESGAMRSHFGRFLSQGVIVEVMGAIQTRAPGDDWLPAIDPADHRVMVDVGGHHFQVPVLSFSYEAEAYERMGRSTRSRLCRV